MKYLDLETCKYLVSLGCTSKSEKCWQLNLQNKVWELIGYSEEEYELAYKLELEVVSAFSLSDLLQKDNAEKINKGRQDTDWEFSKEVLGIFQSYPDTWPAEVRLLISKK